MYGIAYNILYSWRREAFSYILRTKHRYDSSIRSRNFCKTRETSVSTHSALLGHWIRSFVTWDTGMAGTQWQNRIISLPLLISLLDKIDIIAVSFPRVLNWTKRLLESEKITQCCCPRSGSKNDSELRWENGRFCGESVTEMLPNISEEKTPAPTALRILWAIHIERHGVLRVLRGFV